MVCQEFLLEAHNEWSVACLKEKYCESLRAGEKARGPRKESPTCFLRWSNLVGRQIRLEVSSQVALTVTSFQGSESDSVSLRPHSCGFPILGHQCISISSPSLKQTTTVPISRGACMLVAEWDSQGSKEDSREMGDGSRDSGLWLSSAARHLVTAAQRYLVLVIGNKEAEELHPPPSHLFQLKKYRLLCELFF